MRSIEYKHNIRVVLEDMWQYKSWFLSSLENVRKNPSSIRLCSTNTSTAWDWAARASLPSVPWFLASSDPEKSHKCDQIYPWRVKGEWLYAFMPGQASNRLWFVSRPILKWIILFKKDQFNSSLLQRGKKPLQSMLIIEQMSWILIQILGQRGQRCRAEALWHVTFE